MIILILLHIIAFQKKQTIAKIFFAWYAMRCYGLKGGEQWAVGSGQ